MTDIKKPKDAKELTDFEKTGGAAEVRPNESQAVGKKGPVIPSAKKKKLIIES